MSLDSLAHLISTIKVLINLSLGIQMYGNDDTQCPERAGTGANVTKLFIDSSVPSMGGVANWTSDETLEFKCKPPGFKPVSCKCENYKVSGGWV